MHVKRLAIATGLTVGWLLVAALSSTAHAQDVYTWEGDVSSDMADSDNWVGSPVLDFITGDDQWVFGASLGSVTPQLGPGDGESVSWVGQTGAGVVNTAILFDVGAPAYTFGDGGDPARAIGLWTVTTGSADVVNNSGNTQTFNVIVRQRRSTIDAAAGDIVFNGEFRVGDAVNSTAYSATFKGDHNIYLNGPVTGYTGTSTNRSRIFYAGASTTAENAGKLILGDIGTDYANTIVVDSQNGGAVVATHNNSFGAFGSSAKLGTQIGSGSTGDTSNGVVELDGSAGDLTIPESFRLGMRTLDNGATHLRNVAGNNTITGFVSLNQPSTADSPFNSAFIESMAGKLTITGAISNDLPTNPSISLYLKGDGDIDLGGPDGIFASFDTTTSILSIDKSGAGAVTTLAGANNGYSGTTTIHDGSFIVNGTHTTAGAGAYTVETSGTLGGSGTIGSTVQLAGGIAPGESPGTLTVGGLSLLGGILDFELNAADHTAGSGINDLLIVSNADALDLSGGATLNVAGIGGGLTAGDYDLIQFAGALTGTASDISLGTIPLGGGLSASIAIDSDSVNLHVGVGMPGDYNGDGKVNAADYVLWRKDPLSRGGDPGGYNAWRANFGNPPGSGSGSGLSMDASVPEPAALLLAALGMALVFAVGEERRRISLTHTRD